MPSSHDNHEHGTLKWLLSLDNNSFIRNSFQIILGRHADNNGINHYQNILEKNGNKIQIISDLYNSKEARNIHQRQDISDAAFKYKHPIRWRIVHTFRPRQYVLSDHAPNGVPIHHGSRLPLHNQSRDVTGTDISASINRLHDRLINLEFKLDAAHDPRPAKTLGNEKTRYIFNLSTSNQWRRHAVGITRVERELACYLKQFGNVEYVLWDAGSQSLKKLDIAHVNAILSPAWSDPESGCIPYDAAHLAEFPVSRDDIYISVGLDWDHAPTSDVLRYLNRFDARAVLACHDTVPVQFPEFLAREEIAEEFREHLVEMAHGSVKVWANSQTSKRDLIRFWESVKLECDLPTVFTAPLASYATQSKLPILNERDRAILEEVFAKGDYVLYVSSVEPRKNHKLMLDIWRDLWTDRGAACPQFVQVGMRGWGCEETLQRIPRMASYTGGKINTLFQVSDDLLAHLYHNCSFTVFPSLYEGWGLAATEALEFGKVCVVANNSSLEEATQDLAPSYHPHDFLGWKAEIERLLDDIPYRKSLEENIKNKYKSITWKEFGKEFCNNIIMD